MVSVLVIDDDPKMRDLVKAVFETNGFYVTTSEEGEAGVSRALTKTPDVVVTDLSMNGVDGWEVIRRIRNAPQGSGIRIVALSAHTSSGDRDEAYTAGCDAYVNKPVNPNLLFDKISRLIER